MVQPLAVCACVLGVSLLAGCGKSSTETEPVRPVRAIKVADLGEFQGRGYPGRAEPVEEVELSFRVSGPLIALPAKVGDHVKQGDLLAAIDPTDFQTALDLAKGNLERSRAELLAMERGARPEEIEQLKAALAEAQAAAKQALAEFDRNAKLVVDRTVSQSEYDISLARRDQTAARVKKAEEDLRIGQQGAREEDRQAKRAEISALDAAVADAQNKLKYATLSAPFEGDIASKYVENFQTVQAKQPILRLLDTSKIEITLQLPESVISLVPLVKDVVCRIDAFPGREFPGRVTEIGTEATQTTRTYPVKVLLDQPADAKILPGMAATVRGKPDASILKETGNFAIPMSAVFTPETEKKNYVWVVDESAGTVSPRAITTGDLTPGGVKVVEGLQPGEWIVTAGVHSLEEGQKVRLLGQGGN
jgi:RND family efflux transporter MFP subunit